MKKIILCLLSCFFISIFSTSDNEFIEFFKIPLTEQVPWQPPRMLYNKGFIADTLIKTVHGYQPIQDLQIEDIVCGKDNNQQATITDIFYNDVHQFVRLKKDDFTIDVGYEQQFLSQDRSWMLALCISPYDIFVTPDGTKYSFDTIEMIEQDVRTYCITVDNHIYTATKLDVITHNSALIAAPSIILNFIRLVQPVFTLFGTTQSLCYLSSYAPPLEQSNTIIYQASPEKLYFDTRYQQLCKLKQEFVTLHSALKTIKCQFQDQYALLHYQTLFNNQFTNTYNITAQYEATLDFEDRLELTEIRQKILYDLEEEICNIQIALGLFVNEMLHRRSATIEYYNNFTSNSDPIHYCLKLPNNISYQTIINYYIFTATCNMLIEEIDTRNQECLVIDRYLNLKSDALYTTNIIEVLQQTKQNIAAYQQTIQNRLLANQIKIQNIIIYFKTKTKSAFPNITQQISNAKKELHQNLQNKKYINTGQNYPKINPPQKPEHDNDDDEIPRIYVGAKYHSSVANNTKSAAPKNGQAALDFSLPVTGKIRVGISENQIVILARTLLRPQGGSEWHGYATSWESLNKNQKQQTKNILINNGLVNNHGKIL